MFELGVLVFSFANTLVIEWKEFFSLNIYFRLSSLFIYFRCILAVLGLHFLYWFSNCPMGALSDSTQDPNSGPGDQNHVPCNGRQIPNH